MSGLLFILQGMYGKNKQVVIKRLGSVAYQAAWDLQEELCKTPHFNRASPNTSTIATP
ncbi:MAG: hypothetical protein AAF963_03610 [Bacteroidota bacterium]